VSVFRKEKEIIGIDIDERDITNYANGEVKKRGATPDVIINCAAYTDVDRSESEKEMAWPVNWAVMCWLILLTLTSTWADVDVC